MGEKVNTMGWISNDKVQHKFSAGGKLLEQLIRDRVPNQFSVGGIMWIWYNGNQGSWLVLHMFLRKNQTNFKYFFVLTKLQGHFYRWEEVKGWIITVRGWSKKGSFCLFFKKEFPCQISQIQRTSKSIQSIFIISL